MAAGGTALARPSTSIHAHILHSLIILRMYLRTPCVRRFFPTQQTGGTWVYFATSPRDEESPEKKRGSVLGHITLINTFRKNNFPPVHPGPPQSSSLKYWGSICI